MSRATQHRNPIRSNRIHRTLSQQSTRAHTATVIVAAVAMGVVNSLLNALYARSGFPVPFAEGQTTFDGTKLKGYYATMIDQGTMNIYWATQLFDYIFIAAMALLGLVTGSRLIRAAYSDTTYARPLGPLATTGAALVVTGAGLDAIENLISFVMLSQPADFPDWIAIVYSSIAAAKFVAIGLGWVTLIVAIVALAVRRLAIRPLNGSPDTQATT